MVYARINMKGGLGYTISVNTFVALLLFKIFHTDERSEIASYQDNSNTEYLE